jgi:hypothetical protein
MQPEMNASGFEIRHESVTDLEMSSRAAPSERRERFGKKLRDRAGPRHWPTFPPDFRPFRDDRRGSGIRRKSWNNLAIMNYL